MARWLGTVPPVFLANPKFASGESPSTGFVLEDRVATSLLVLPVPKLQHPFGAAFRECPPRDRHPGNLRVVGNPRVSNDFVKIRHRLILTRPERLRKDGG
jgi:hypothetical protein